MATVALFSVAVTTAGSPRISSTVNYAGTRDKSVLLQIVSPTWAVDDPTITVHLSIQQSFDNGVTWLEYCSTDVHPQTFNPRGGGLPILSCIANDDMGARKVRGVLSVDKLALTLGVDATV